jgi:hypothetical protein
MNKKAAVLPFAAFLIILSFPIITSNRINGAVLQNEKRQAAAFPTLFNEQGKLNGGLKESFTAWLNDNIGFRTQFVKLYSIAKIRLLKISTSPLVHFGRDGWYFYTNDRNLDIGLGNYQPSEEVLQKTTDVQQAVSDYYADKGVKYVLMMNPSKASVYTEYIGSGKYKTGDTVIDAMEKRLQERTNVSVVNTKNALLAERAESPERLLYWKTDTHWNTLGAYVGYRAVLDEFNRLGITRNEKPIEVTIGELTGRTGEFGAMLGDRDILDKEDGPDALFSEKFADYNQYNPNDYFNQAVALSWNPKNPNYFRVYENPVAENGTLLIYGDSMTMVRSGFFAKHFKRVVLAGMSGRPCNIPLEDFVKPDVVLFSSVERYLTSRLPTLPNLPAPPALPVSSDVLADTPVRPRVKTGVGFKGGGMWLDYSNGEVITNPQEVRLQTGADCNLVGWAFDVDTTQPLKALYIKAGGALFKCNYGIERTSVSNAFKNQDLLKTGFSVTIPIRYLVGVSEVGFIMVGGGGWNRRLLSIRTGNVYGEYA